jgi:hypothetical protein
MNTPPQDCTRCGWWRKRNSIRKGVQIPDGTGKCTRPEGHCDPHTVKGRIGEGKRERRTDETNT